MYKRYMLIKPVCSNSCGVGRVFEAFQKTHFHDDQKFEPRCEGCDEKVHLETGNYKIVVEEENRFTARGCLRSHVIELPGEETIQEIEETLELEKQ